MFYNRGFPIERHIFWILGVNMRHTVEFSAV